MPGNAFIQFPGITGESYQQGHTGDAGWIEIADWGWDVEAETSFLKGGGSAVGKPQPGVLSFTHYYDLSSPVIMTHIVAGKTFPKITIEILKQIGDDEKGQPAVFFQVVLTNAYITKVATKGSEDGAVNQDVEMVFKEIAIGYKPQNNDGTLAPAMAFGWSVTAMDNTVTNPTSLS